MKLSTRDKKLLLILLGIVVFLVCWLGVRSKFIDKADTIAAEISALKPRLEELRTHEAKLSEYEKGIDEIAEDVTLELKKFPGDVRPEDMIMYADKLEKSLGLSVGSIAFQPAELIAQFNVPIEGESGSELVPYAAMRTGLSIGCELSYAQMKKLVKYIYATPQRTTLESISVSYNAENGDLSGNAVMSKFFMTGENYKYTETDIPHTNTGVSNPFGTIERETEIDDPQPSGSLSPLPSINPKPTPSGSGSGTN